MHDAGQDRTRANETALRAQLEQAIALHRQGRVNEAEPFYRSVLHGNPHDRHLAPAWINHGALLHVLARYEEALASYDRALALHPGSPDALTNRGHTLIELGRFEEALANLNAVIDAHPAMPAAFNNR